MVRANQCKGTGKVEVAAVRQAIPGGAVYDVASEIRDGKGLPVKPVMFLLLLCPAAYAAACPSGQAKDEATLLQIEHTWVQADEKHDVAMLGCILGSDFEEAGSEGQLIDRSHMLQSTVAPNSQPVHYELQEVHAHVYGDVAYVRGIGAAMQNGKAIPKTRFTDIFVYREERWQCVAGHESLFPTPHP